MKKLVLALTALAALTATPALARTDTHLSIGIFAPAQPVYVPPPVYYQPPPVVTYAPRPIVYYGQYPYYDAYEHHRRYYRGYEGRWHDRDDDHGRDWHDNGRGNGRDGRR